jgi:signal transduction histidine kinase
MFDWFRRSLSLRLLAIFILTGGLFIYGALGAIRFVYNSDDVRGLISGHLSLHVNYVLQDIGSPPDIGRAIAITERVPVDIRILGPDVDWASDPEFPILSELEFGPSPFFSDRPDAWVDELKGVEFAEFDRHNFLKMQQDGYDIVVSTPRIREKPGGPNLVLMIIAFGVALLFLAFLSVQWLFRPIRQIREGAASIGRGRFDYRIATTRNDQLGELAADINKMAGSVQDLLDAKRALLIGISHELRTPLSRMRLSLEFLEDEQSRDMLKEEIREMEKIVAELLEAERLNGRHAKLTRSRVRMVELMHELLDDFFSRDVDRIELLPVDADLYGNIDEARVTLLLKNLLSNALRYSPEDAAPVKLGVSREGEELVFVVHDDGPGIPQEQLEHIGEPFYRGDPSRARHTGGTGLGLYLALLVARAHGGSLTLKNPGRPGACFEIRIPG